MSRLWQWNFEDGSEVTASIGAFGGTRVTVDGRKLKPGKAGLRKRSFTVQLRTSEAVLHYGSSMGLGHTCELRVDGKLVLPTQAPPYFATALTACPSCKAALRQDDGFCGSCGKAVPSPDSLVRRSEAAQGNTAVGLLSGLFLFSGLVMYFVRRSALRAIARIPDGAVLSEGDWALASIPGMLTYGELRAHIEWEATSVLVANLVLAGLMFGLWLWGKRKPGPATIIAFCTFIVVQVVNAAVDPKTLAQGWILKFIVIVFLLRGLKAAVAERSAAQAVSG